jgi:hypothetical protein
VLVAADPHTSEDAHDRALGYVDIGDGGVDVVAVLAAATLSVGRLDVASINSGATADRVMSTRMGQRHSRK